MANVCMSTPCLLVATYLKLIENCPRAVQGLSPAARVIDLCKSTESVRAESNKESRNDSPCLQLIFGGFL